ncbi:MAG: ketoacyl-ACP synthase III [Dysgonamonadaceae bacterium]|jgi:3-oxoacyl-[acyl-carrier-protein] synthase-3|nr:ketoacyl-ACP synthase III [Dysgonamonadaceae bacterium]
MSLKFTFRNKRISGILTVLPKQEIKFEDEMAQYNFPPAKSLKLKLAMGYNKHRIVEAGTNVSDLCVYGIDYLLNEGLLEKDDISALLLVTQSPEHFLPPTSNIIQGKLELGTDVLCMDINQGCAGFIIGLLQAYMLLEQESIKKVLLLNADVLSRKISKRDRNSNPLAGDAATITVVERSLEPTTIQSVLNMDGKGAYVLQIPAGGFKLPSSPETAEMKEDENGNFRSLDHLVMKGDEVFNFVQKEVPPMIEELLAISGKKADDIDFYFFHQPNKFMLNKLADKIGVSREKMPANIVENFGNASGATVPLAVSYNLGADALASTYEVCFAGFGVGLTWAAIQQKLEKFQFNHIIYY